MSERGFEWDQNRTIYETKYYTSKPMRKDMMLFLRASYFTPRSSSYSKESLSKLEKLIDQVVFSDVKFTSALAWFLGHNMGIRLAPIIMTIKLSEKTKKKYLQQLVKDVFTRPDCIAHAFRYWKFTKGEIISFPKRVFPLLRKQLETFDKETLKKQKMRRREFKLKDLIKILKPQPANSEMSKFYKEIIEDGKESKISISTDKKFERLLREEPELTQENISEASIDTLVRSLPHIKPEYVEQVKTRLDSVFESGQGFRFIHPFDLLILHEYVDCESDNCQQMLDVLDQILVKYVQPQISARRPVILYDRSISMKQIGHRAGSKIIALMGNLFNSDFRFYTFASKNSHLSNLPAGITDITDQFRDLKSQGPNFIARYIKDSITCFGGAELVNAIKWVIENNRRMDLFIIITNQTSFEESQIGEYQKVIPSRLCNRIFLINMNPSPKNILKLGKNIIQLPGLDSKLFQVIDAIINFDKFKKKINAQFEARVSEEMRKRRASSIEEKSQLT